jgi:hypothetical protein
MAHLLVGRLEVKAGDCMFFLELTAAAMVASAPVPSGIGITVDEGDYPPDALRAQVERRTTARLSVDAREAVKHCVSSSGLFDLADFYAMIADPVDAPAQLGPLLKRPLLGLYALAVAVLWLGVPAVGSAAATTVPRDLAQAAADYDRAQIQGDRVALNRLLAEDYRLVNSGAEVETKAQFVAESSDPTFKLAPFVVTAPTEIVWNDGAVFAGEVRLIGTSAGKPFSTRIRFADVWARRDGRWQVVFTEVTPLPASKR